MRHADPPSQARPVATGAPWRFFALFGGVGALLVISLLARADIALR